MYWNEIFELDQVTGKLYWKVKPAQCTYIGDEAGTLNSDGYMQVRYKRKQYYSHRIIWEMLYGAIPEGLRIDHINLMTADNRPCNLRLATVAQNQHNHNLSRANTSGIKGVHYRCSRPKGCSKVYEYWIATLNHNRKTTHKLFPYTDAGKLEAVNWVRTAREQLHVEFANHG